METRNEESRIGIAWFISTVPYHIFIISEFIPGKGLPGYMKLR